MSSINPITSKLASIKLLNDIHKNPKKYFDANSVVMHGTNINIADTGFDSIHSQDGLIYASDDVNYALFLSIIEISEEEGGTASVFYKGSNIQLTIDKDFVNGQSHFVNGRIYFFSKKDFVRTKAKHEFVSKNKTVMPIGFVEVTPKDLKIPVTINFN